jgi:hypothetical protein
MEMEAMFSFELQMRNALAAGENAILLGCATPYSLV